MADMELEGWLIRFTGNLLKPKLFNKNVTLFIIKPNCLMFKKNYFVLNMLCCMYVAYDTRY